MFFGFQLTCGLMMVFYGYSVMKNPRVWGDQGRRAVKPEHFEEYGRQNGLFFLKAGCVMAVIGALDALVTLDAVLYLLLYVFGFAFAFYPLTRWCKANEGFSWPWPHVKSEKKRIRELRKEQYGDALDRWFRLGKNLNQRDTIAVRRTVDGLLKLIYPDGKFSKEELEEVLQIALEMRRRVKEQLKKLGGMEFYDVNFSYIDLDTFEEKFVSVPEQGGGKLIPDGMCNPGQIYTVSRGKSGMIGVFRLESQMLPGSGKFERTGLGSDRDCKESTNTAFNFLKANGKRISGGISTASKDYIINYQDLQGIGMTGKLALPTLIALCSIALGRPTVSTLAVLGEISISGTILKVDELANSLQVCLDSGAKKVLLPITSAADLGTVPPLSLIHI